MADSAETLDTLSSHLNDLQEHRKAEKKDKGFTAVGYMEKENSAVIARFDKATQSNTIHLTAVEAGKQLKKEISNRRKTMSSNGKITLESLEIARIRPLFGLNLLRQSSHIWANGEKGQPARAACKGSRQPPCSHPGWHPAGTLLAPCWVQDCTILCLIMKKVDIV